MANENKAKALKAIKIVGGGGEKLNFMEAKMRLTTESLILLLKVKDL